MSDSSFSYLTRFVSSRREKKPVRLDSQPRRDKFPIKLKPSTLISISLIILLLSNHTEKRWTSKILNHFVCVLLAQLYSFRLLVYTT